ncbi:MAG: bifunctional 3-(3-hydroxy-phenyl)propionate/3-hydroxycinnamic acid hydroxylase [Pseudorhodoferax sp.]
METTQVPVLIVGAGPVGVTIANLLGAYGVRTLVIERSPAIHEYPRAVGLDDEALRTFQAAGLSELMLRDMIQNVPMRLYGARKECLAEIQPATREFGFFRRNLFSQPLGEATLRAGLQRFPHVELRLGVELLDLAQDAEGVTATVRGADGTASAIRALYLVGCDGGRSTVREGLLKLSFEGRTHAHKWAVLECEDDPLDAPYTALHCEPARPYVCLRLPYGLRRWEFMLFPGEDAEQMLSPQKVQQLLRAHVADPSTLKIIRARVYTHNSRVAGAFVTGRVCLAGDAAHITPPWIGQGLNAGLRDAFNLAWKLAWIVQGRLRPELLQSYHDERHAHAKAMIDLADLFGAVLSQRNRAVAWVRDRLLLALRAIPRLRDYVLQMRFKPMPRYEKGIVQESGRRDEDAAVGRMFIQPLVESGGAVQRLDDIVQGRFVLLSWRCDAMAGAGPQLLDQFAQLKVMRICAVRSRSGAHEVPRPAGACPPALLVEDAESQLNGWFQAHGVDWVLLRPDRYVAAMGRAHEATARLGALCGAWLPPPSAMPAARLAAASMALARSSASQAEACSGSAEDAAFRADPAPVAEDAPHR